MAINLTLTVEETVVNLRVNAGGYVPPGGTTGQVLVKASGSDLDTQWATVSGVGGSVDSVNGQTGIITLDTDDIGEGVANLYHTDARVSANANVAANTTHRSAIDNPHSVTKAQVGLSNVDNTSDANKPISTATQAALDGKVDDAQVLTNVPLGAVFTDTVYNDTAIQSEVDLNTAKVSADGSVTTHNDVTDAGSGAIITGAERTKLAGIETGATADQTGAELVTAIDTELGNTDWQSGGGGGGSDWTTLHLANDFILSEQTTNQDIPGMSFSVPANSVVLLEGSVLHFANSTPDGTLTITTDPINANIRFYDDTDSPGATTSGATDANFMNGLNSIRGYFFQGGGHTDGESIVIKMQLRQNTSSTDETSVRRGTWMRYKIITP